MGWYTVATLEVDKSSVDADICVLVTRGGLVGLAIGVSPKTA